MEFLHKLFNCLFYFLHVFCFAVLRMVESLLIWTGIRPKISAGKCEIRTILWRSRIFHLDRSSAHRNFLSWHAGFADADAILSENVCLYTFDDKEAIFAEFDGPVHIDLASQKTPFMYIAEFNRAKRLFKLPIARFGQLIDAKLGTKMSGRVSILGTEGRCGSTLMVKVLSHYCPSLVALSEPGFLIQLAHLSRSLSAQKLDDLTNLVMRYSCRPVNGEARHYFIKLLPASSHMLPQLHKCVPSARLLYLTRQDERKLLESGKQRFSVFPLLYMVRLLIFCRLSSLASITNALYGASPQLLAVWAPVQANVGMLNIANVYELVGWFGVHARLLLKHCQDSLPDGCMQLFTYEQLCGDMADVLTRLSAHLDLQEPLNLSAAMEASKEHAYSGATDKGLKQERVKTEFNAPEDVCGRIRAFYRAAGLTPPNL